MATRNRIAVTTPKNPTKLNFVTWLGLSLILTLVIFQLGREVAPKLTPATSEPTVIIAPQNPALPKLNTAPGVSAPPVTQSSSTTTRQAKPVPTTQGS